MSSAGRILAQRSSTVNTETMNPNLVELGSPQGLLLLPLPKVPGGCKKAAMRKDERKRAAKRRSFFC